jgi:hypothetical protein
LCASDLQEVLSVIQLYDRDGALVAEVLTALVAAIRSDSGAGRDAASGNLAAAHQADASRLEAILAAIAEQRAA